MACTYTSNHPGVKLIMSRVFLTKEYRLYPWPNRLRYLSQIAVKLSLFSTSRIGPLTTCLRRAHGSAHAVVSCLARKAWRDNVDNTLSINTTNRCPLLRSKMEASWHHGPPYADFHVKPAEHREILAGLPKHSLLASTCEDRPPPIGGRHFSQYLLKAVRCRPLLLPCRPW